MAQRTRTTQDLRRPSSPLVRDRESLWFLLPVPAGVLLALFAYVFLARVRSEPGHPVTPLSRWGSRLGETLVGLWAHGIVLNVMQFEVPSWIDAVLAVGMAEALVAMVVLAWLDRPDHARD